MAAFVGERIEVASGRSDPSKAASPGLTLSRLIVNTEALDWCDQHDVEEARDAGAVWHELTFTVDEYEFTTQTTLIPSASVEKNMAHISLAISHCMMVIGFFKGRDTMQEAVEFMGNEFEELSNAEVLERLSVGGGFDETPYRAWMKAVAQNLQSVNMVFLAEVETYLDEEFCE